MVAIEGYEIFAELQRGPWVSVFKAFDHRQQRMVIIKALREPAAPARVREQLRVEGEIGRRLIHPNLRQVYAAGGLQDNPYLVLEYVEGGTLAELLHRALPIELCVWIAREVARALQVLHQHGILHRDVKPKNIFVANTGAVKLADLGLAVDREEAQCHPAGTLAYFPPEIVLGQPATPASDLFSLGAVLYEMLTGEPPFADHTQSALLHRIANLDPTPVEKLRPEIPAELAALSRKLLAKTPATRFASAAELLAELERFERRYELRTTAQKLAAFLESPESYVAVKYAAPAEPVPARTAATRTKSAARPLWRVVPATALVLAGISIGLLNLQFDADASLPSKTMNAAEMTAQNGTPAADVPQTLTGAAPPASATAAASTAVAAPPVPAASQDRENHTAAAVTTTTANASGPPSHRVLLLSEPRARVFVEGDSLGTTPLYWQPAAATRVYKLQFAVQSLPVVTAEVVAAALESDTLYFNLHDEIGYLEVAVNPWGEIWIDGKAYDTTPLVAPLALSPGLHEISVRHPRLGTQTQRVIIAKGDTLRRFFDLFLP
ncbi:MAG: serine/threonine protein kinase [candidate division KSB1 bacterium]|nr:serine/threonine protein kinase [candidate division KSB1 bacterium]MDZ7273199.1 serine/threonine protein kinase [candidate division KSB1 bacterium]MDZ7285301.1 serine/threonine protein kinase [candidate division KSB1 bacterium]MDZ7298333.1 serine/threonine protein kinase [candidate division KSB1 bacterium]MDZ7349034.1 serine/threonine protein kinase [candidate division KSB1 bacterium]